MDGKVIGKYELGIIRHISMPNEKGVFAERY
jgi:hypothetical protein